MCIIQIVQLFFSKYYVFSWISDIFVLFNTFSIDFYLLFLSSSMSSLSVAMKSSSSSNTPAITTSLIYYPIAALLTHNYTELFTLLQKTEYIFLFLLIVRLMAKVFTSVSNVLSSLSFFSLLLTE